MNSAASTPRQPLTSNGSRLTRRPQRALILVRAAPTPRRGPIRVTPWIFLLAIGLAASLLTGAASAGALVEFPNTSEQAPKLLGYLARPDSGLSAVLGSPSNDGGPYAAVVVLHGCAGFSGYAPTLADRVASWSRSRSTASARAALPAPAAAGFWARRSMPTRHCATCRAWISSIPCGLLSAANRWAAFRRCMLSRGTWLRNISQSGFALRSPITRAAAPPRPP